MVPRPRRGRRCGLQGWQRRVLTALVVSRAAVPLRDSCQWLLAGVEGKVTLRDWLVLCGSAGEGDLLPGRSCSCSHDVAQIVPWLHSSTPVSSSENLGCEKAHGSREWSGYVQVKAWSQLRKTLSASKEHHRP